MDELVDHVGNLGLQQSARLVEQRSIEDNSLSQPLWREGGVWIEVNWSGRETMTRKTTEEVASTKTAGIVRP